MGNNDGSTNVEAQVHSAATAGMLKIPLKVIESVPQFDEARLCRNLSLKF